MEAYNYTTEPTILSDSRVRKKVFAKLVWQEKDLATKMLGFEYSDMLTPNAIYDLENDFPAVFYFCGYFGFALYLLFFCLFYLDNPPRFCPGGAPDKRGRTQKEPRRTFQRKIS